MQKHHIRIEFRHVELSYLETEDDFRREAKRLLPEALVQLGEAIGEETWSTLQKGLRGSKFKVNTSSSEKQKFVKEAGKNYRTKASAKERKELEDYIVQQLRKHQEQY
jgi:hypothetical protein